MQGWTVADLKKEVKSRLGLKTDVKLAIVRDTSIQTLLKDDHPADEIDLTRMTNLMAFESLEGEGSYSVELTFFRKKQLLRKGPMTVSECVNATPRLMTFSKRSTVLEIKQAIAKNLKDMLTADTEFDD